MKLKLSAIIAMISLFSTPTVAQECDSLFIGNRTTMGVGNGSPTRSGAVQFISNFVYGKLEITASSAKWASSIGFETSLSDSSICRAGIVLSNGALVVYRTFQEPGSDCAAKPQFKKSYPVPGWESLKEKENKYTFLWREGDVELVINDTLSIPHDPVFPDSLPNQPMMPTFRTNIDLEFNPAGVIDTIKTTYVCFSYLTPTRVVEQDQTPQGYSLSQNYPNPFNPETAIRYELPKTTKVSLYILNEMGQRVRTLVSSTQTTGTYTIVWNGKDDFGREVASGIYLYQMVTEDFVETKKLMLVR